MIVVVVVVTVIPYNNIGQQNNKDREVAYFHLLFCALKNGKSVQEQWWSRRLVRAVQPVARILFVSSAREPMNEGKRVGESAQ